MKRIETVYPGYEFWTDENDHAVLVDGSNHGHPFIADVDVYETDEGGLCHTVGTDRKYFTAGEMAQMLGVDSVHWDEDYVLETHHYGHEPTTLRLSKKAQAVYDSTDPIDIYEIETPAHFYYDVRGCFEKNHLTESELNEFLEEIADEEV